MALTPDVCMDGGNVLADARGVFEPKLPSLDLLSYRGAAESWCCAGSNARNDVALHRAHRVPTRAAKQVRLLLAWIALRSASTERQPVGVRETGESRSSERAGWREGSPNVEAALLQQRTHRMQLMPSGAAASRTVAPAR